MSNKKNPTNSFQVDIRRILPGRQDSLPDCVLQAGKNRFSVVRRLRKSRELLMGDMVNYTDIESVIQISEVRIDKVN